MADTDRDRAVAWFARQLADLLANETAAPILADVEVREETWSQYVVDPATGEETGPHRMRQLVFTLPATRDTTTTEDTRG